MSDEIVKNEHSAVLPGIEAAGSLATGTLAVTAATAPAATVAEIAAITGATVSAPAVAVVAGLASVALLAKTGYDMMHFNDEQAQVVNDRIQENAAKQAAAGQER